jgi:hypothetical protein
MDFLCELRRVPQKKFDITAFASTPSTHINPDTSTTWRTKFMMVPLASISVGFRF